MSTPRESLFIADHLALDFVNTAFGTTHPVEILSNDLAVYHWLIEAGIEVESMARPALKSEGELLSDALELRAIAYELIVSYKNGKEADPRELNSFLSRGSSYYQIELNDKQNWVLKTHRHHLSVKDFLTPIAEAIADLIANVDFSLVRQCECPDCTLWFYDSTKSHKRRWCDMAICGNRMKAAAYRARKKT
jgi:predicted RNA-binding Zn ribbon-like protein